LKTLQIVGNARYGGATRLMLEWSQFLLAHNCQVDILCTDKRMQDEARAIAGAGLVDHIFVPKEIRPVANTRAFLQFVTYFRQQRYDIVHTYTAMPSFLGRLAASVARVPVVLNHQGGWAVNEISSFLEKTVYTPAEYIGTLACTKNICVSYSEIEKAKAYRLAPLRKLVTIVNGIDPAKFVAAVADDSNRKRVRKELRNTLNLAEDTILIGNTGRLVATKGNDTLILALDLLRERVPNLSIALALAGDGEEKERLTALIIRLGLEDQVRLLGFYQDIPEFLAGIDIFVTPTLTEGLSISLLEAMATRCPIIATDIPANSEVITHQETGLLVSVAAPDEIADAMLRFIREPELASACSANAQQRALDYYTQERMFQETWDLYNNLLTQHENRVLYPVQTEKKQAGY